MIRSLGGVLASRLQRWIPEPFVFAIILTLLIAIMALAMTDAGMNKIIDDWYRGFWILLEFGMQMVLILSTGFAIALSPIVSRLIDRLALLARTPGAVYLLVMIAGGLFSLVSWGWTVLTAVLARELARRVENIDYGYLVACVYLSMQPWVGGLSSSIPLLLNTDGNFLIETGVLAGTIPVTSTLGSTLNWMYLAVYFVTLPVLMWLMQLAPMPPGRSTNWLMPITRPRARSPTRRRVTLLPETRSRPVEQWGSPATDYRPGGGLVRYPSLCQQRLRY